jgi:outer membrane protein
MYDLFRQKKTSAIIIVLILLCPFLTRAQNTAADTAAKKVTLKMAIDFAIKNQPRIQQSLLDEQITQSNIRSRLADWYPQVNFNYNLQHNFILQQTVIGGNTIRLGVNNTSSGLFSVSQTIFNRDVLLANRTKEDVLQQTKQTTSGNKIDIAVNVSKAFYDVITTQQQIRVAAENIVRTERSLKDATNQYKAGIADKIDYKRATISLNNIKAAKRINEEQVKAKMEYLKSLMGYPDSLSFTISYDSLQMENEIIIDTLQQPDYTSRIEYRLLETQQNLLRSNVLYNKWSYLPSLSANGAYNLNFQNNDFGKLYNTNYPNSFAALTLAFPIFQGGKRKANLYTAQLQLQRSQQDIINLKNSVNAQYAQAIANYKSNLENYVALKENIAIAREVYDVVHLQYRSGIKTFLEVITAETDLRTSQINYLNALNQVLAAKVDVQKALGQINY